MPEGLSTSAANSILDAIGNATSFSVTSLHAQLHTGPPGAIGTANAAANTTRAAVSFAAALGGSITNDAAVEWLNVPATEVYSHVSLWDAATGGTFIGSGGIVGGSVSTGDNFAIPAGEIVLAFQVAS